MQHSMLRLERLSVSVTCLGPASLWSQRPQARSMVDNRYHQDLGKLVTNLG